MDEESRQYTAFGTHTHGLLQWKRMPMGILNSSATFERMIEIVLGPLLYDICLAYIDDLICYSVNRKCHIDDLSRILEKLL